VVAYLLANGAEVDKTDDSGWTALHVAVSSGHEEVVRELVGAGADMNRKNDKGITSLFVFSESLTSRNVAMIRDP